MATLKQEAQEYQPATTKNIAELDSFSVNVDIFDKERTDSEGKTFNFKYIVVDGIEYRVPNSVLEQIQMMLQELPNLENVKVIKKGEGMNTSYTVVQKDASSPKLVGEMQA